MIADGLQGGGVDGGGDEAATRPADPGGWHHPALRPAGVTGLRSIPGEEVAPRSWAGSSLKGVAVLGSSFLFSPQSCSA